MKANYHTHTFRCLHAEGTDEMYVQAALEAGFDALGFADHTPWPYESGYVSPIRMETSQLFDYVSSVRGLREKYAGKIALHIGLECEYFPRYMGWLKEAREAYGLEYLIFGAHYFDSDEDSAYVGSACVEDKMVSRYADMVMEGMDTGLYACLAHPDLYMRRRTDWNAACRRAAQDICRAALEKGMPLEYNLNAHVLRGLGRSGFPRREFWECAAETGNRVLIGYDAHQPSLLLSRQAEEEIRGFLTGLGLMPLDCLEIDETSGARRSNP